MVIPWQEIKLTTLYNLVESFVLREGTDYGEIEKTLAEKVEEVITQIKQGKIIIVWSELHETIDFRSAK